MRTATCLLTCALAAAAASPAAGQAVTTASVRIETAGGVQVTRGAPPALAESPGFVVFSLSAHANGSIDLSVLGFLPESGGERLAAGEAKSFAGTTLDREALSVSIALSEQDSAERQEQIRVVVAQYN